MSDENDREKNNPENVVRWWVRHAFIPIAIASIAAISAIIAAEKVAGTPAPTAGPALISTPTPPTAGRTGDLTNGEADLPTFTPTHTPTPSPTPTQTATSTPTLPSAPQEIIGQHVVQPGETLYCIGRAYGVQPDAIAQANGLVSPFTLYSGQALVIPAAPWKAIPPGRACRQQFASPFVTTTVAAEPISPMIASATASPSSTATRTPTSTPSPTASPIATTPIPLTLAGATNTPTATPTSTTTGAPIPTLAIVPYQGLLPPIGRHASYGRR